MTMRVLLKLSGEALGGGDGRGLEPAGLAPLALEIREFMDAGGELGIVVGGGNLVRGAALAEAGSDRVTADHIGTLGTIMNGLAMAEVLKQHGLKTRVFSSVAVAGIAEGYQRDAAVAALAEGTVCFFTGGTGNPLFTTDTAACLRGIEVQADLVLKATKVDGVYSADPNRDATATRFDELTYNEVLSRGLAVMDLPAIWLCQDHGMPLVVFDMTTPGGLARIVRGEPVGTRIAAE
ncbi:MAG: UMP kinase [Pseudomonadota bacterium]